MTLKFETENLLFRVFNILNALEEANPIINFGDGEMTYNDMIEEVNCCKVTASDLRKHFADNYDMDIE